MVEMRERRSPRLALQLPIRVFGIDFKGNDFVEDSLTVVVNLHGAKIKLNHLLIVDQEIRVLCYTSKQEAVFRVASWAGNSEHDFFFWGIECVTPERNVWGIKVPVLAPDDQTKVRVMVQCPECQTRELLHIEELTLHSLQDSEGLKRTCPLCKKTGFWKQVAYTES